ncbi:unnamed protein product [Toxocara canis]|uniref:FABP domain-containing protein n=1 Tax=Toxocara canis TaxID=6265 RepID=A0A183URT1_TOXCA|nr:unnamed protein product [Toxocara canis]
MPRALYLFIIALLLCVGAKRLPDKFLGKFKLEKSINLDEYLTARGYRWLARRLIMLASVTKIIKKAASGLPFRYDMDTLTWKKNVFYRDFVLGRQFESEELEEGLFKVKLDLKNGTDIMTENIVRIDDPDDDETFEYIREGEYLIMVSLISVEIVRYI